MRLRGITKARRAWAVAESLRSLLKGREKLRHTDAVLHIESRHGKEFLYRNRNGNVAIDGVVLALFEMFTEPELVWSKAARCWRRRQASDPKVKRMVAF